MPELYEPYCSVMPTAPRRRQDDIVTAAIRLLEKSEFDQVQVRDVAKRAGVAVATLYRHFPSKEQLYAQAFLTWSAPFEENVEALTSRGGSDASRLLLFLEHTIAAYERTPSFHKLITSLELATDPVARKGFWLFAEKYHRLCLDVLTDVDDYHSELIVSIALAVMHRLLKQWACGEIEIDTVYSRLHDTIALVFGRPSHKIERLEPRPVRSHKKTIARQPSKARLAS